MTLVRGIARKSTSISRISIKILFGYDICHFVENQISSNLILMLKLKGVITVTLMFLRIMS